MLPNSKIIAFAATTKPSQAMEFYRDKLGLTFVSDDHFALIFDGGGSTLRIQKLDTFNPHPFTSLGWEVADIEAAVSDLESRGVEFEHYDFVRDERGIWNAPGGVRVAWFKDPDGNTLSISHHPKPDTG